MKTVSVLFKFYDIGIAIRPRECIIQDSANGEMFKQFVTYLDTLRIKSTIIGEERIS